MNDEMELTPAQEPAGTEPVRTLKQAPRLPETEAPIPAPAQEEPEAPALPERVTVCDIQFRSGSKIYFFDPGTLQLKNGDHVIIDTARGAEYGVCVLGNHRVASRDLVQPLRKVLRIATPADERTKAENEKKERTAYAFCQKKIEELGLDMQLVSAECAFDGSKLLFFFTADARVDFRELVKILASNYHTRIELRQIGVRDKAKMLGGLGICGRPFCCASFLEDFEPVSIKMAKTQNLSLNPTKISGTCGRLMCCLKYEQDAYEDLIKTSPKPESFVDTPDGRGTVVNVNLMKQSVGVRMEQDPEEIHCYRNCDICVLRSGKAKKTDPPIPEDLAPISGRREEDPMQRLSKVEQRLTLSPEEEEFHAAEAPEAPEQKPARRREGRERNNRPDRPKENAPAQKGQEAERKPEGKKQDRSGQGKAPKLPASAPAGVVEMTEKPAGQQKKRQNRSARRHYDRTGTPHAAPVPEAAPAPVQEHAPKAEGQKKNNRRRYYHHRKPKAE